MSPALAEEYWQVYPLQSEKSEQIAADHGLTQVAAQVLLNRGLSDPQMITQHLSGRLAELPDPLQIPGVSDAVAVLCEAVYEKLSVTLFGDYDVDGMTGCSILSDFLQRCGVSVSIYIPDRSTEGYGVSVAGLEKIAEQGADIVVTIDNGTSAFEELEWATSHGLRVIVIDHHESPTRMPACEALVNPKHPQSEHPDKNLCSAGLAFNLMIALRARLRAEGFFKDKIEPDLKDLLDLACLGTVADMVPLLGQNRLLVRYGLEKIHQGLRPGVMALKKVSAIQDKVIGTGEVGFQLAPRLNAAGRMDDARLGVQLLTTQNSREAKSLAEKLDRLNQQRRDVETQMIEEAIEQVEGQPESQRQYGIVVASPDWHPGVMGIVAAKLTELYHRPAFVIALQGETGKGSARTFGGVDLYESMLACSDYLLKFGGHRQAAGLTIAVDQVQPFAEQLQEVIASNLSPEGFRATLKIDQIWPTDDITEQAVTDLESLAPFGIGYPSPLFQTEPVQLLNPRILKDRHLKVTIAGRKKRWSAIGFDLAERYEAVSDAKTFEIIYRPGWNEYRGSRKVELFLKSLRPVTK